MIEFRAFEQDTGWGEWQDTDVQTHGYCSEGVIESLLEKHRPDLKLTPDETSGMSLGETEGTGAPTDVGIAMMGHTKGLICVEYRPKV